MPIDRKLSALALAGLVAASSPATALGAGGIVIGAYDPDYAFYESPAIGLDHVFVQWQDWDRDLLAWAQQNAAEKGRQFLVTVEPWTRAPDRIGGGETLLPDIVGGAFDAEIAAICGTLGAPGTPVLIRFAHEMEMGRNIFPWSNRAPSEYVAAYRHFVEQCARLAPEAAFVWSPAGHEGAALYYPGDDYVDYASLSVFALEGWDRAHRGKPLSVRRRIAEQAHWIEAIHKPLIIAEFGVAGGKRQEHDWLEEVNEMAAGIGVLDRLVAIVYFNAPETFFWPEPHGRPDWRVAPDVFY
ncbi:beta-mannosidase [Arsenicitalea aurantiaca]|uniref:Beta-mannosidase n=1 Tax=Arsenicitalea aurantiaca TaxID=1783274 RepID=A0A433XL60_9HYPH|nr:glycosyl hydrolase [Arsenicitalea aurantiaca]RUT34819.1 beta-mannosidase [Arsenicitalea aurantiaca]